MISLQELWVATPCSNDASLLMNKGQSRHASFSMICSDHQQDLGEMGGM